MKKVLIILFILLSGSLYAQKISVSKNGNWTISKSGNLLVNYVATPAATQIIANHTIVDRYDDIPAQWIDSVKKMFVTIPGESHSEGYRTGALLLEQSNATYAVSVVESGTPEEYTDTNLRLSRATWGNYANETGWQYAFQSIDAGGGEYPAYTYNATEAERIAAGLAYAHANSLTIAAFGIGYCYWDG